MSAFPTLLDIAIANGSDMTIGLIEETIKAVPEISKAASRTIKGQFFKTLVRTSLPAVAFRKANAGAATSKSTYENRMTETFFFNPQWNCDVAVADAFEDGAAAYLATEAQGIMESAWQYLGKQFYYGFANTTTSNLNDALGNPGLCQYVDSSMVYNAAGTTANTGSSVWAVRFGIRDVTWVWGQEGQLAMKPVRQQTLYDGSGNPYLGYIQELLAYPGLQFSRKYSAGRIKNITADAGHTLTDAMISNLLSDFPTGLPPDYLFMSRRSLQQLQASRTATTPTGAPAPYPQDSFGIPILVTDSILNTEPIA